MNETETGKIKTIGQLKDAVLYETDGDFDNGYGNHLREFFSLAGAALGHKSGGISLGFLEEIIDRNYDALKLQVDEHFQEFEQNQQQAER